ncbi:DNA-binding protein RFX2 [Pundamilia nyererei]|uniref:DNA-binding protein RFX2 n=1 Tax=Pundamilia nyererei TaxID=303518 RepID=A0A9Y6JDU2_9CICH|nr:PREDICTED: DNA-binding protein RFX2 [Pundamilia nyererei]
MQNSEGGSETTTSVAALRTSSSAQAPVVQPVPASQQRVLVQATGSAQKGGQVQQLSVPRAQQVPQQVQQVQHVYPSQVQYVGDSGDAVYTNGTIRTAYSYNPEAQLYGQSSGGPYFDSQAGGGHVTTVVSSASGGVPTHGMVGITMDVGSSHIISSGSTYLIHGGNMEGSRNHISHSSRSSSAMLEMAIENLQKSEGIASHKSSLLNSHLQWLLDNYETAEGVSLPRSSLYNHYLRHCQEQKLDPVNAASFGKLIRSVFMGLRTRRLGTRGNSKYHYYGIRVKPDSPLNRLQEDTQYMAMRQQPVHQKQRFKPLQKVDSMSDSLCGSSQHCSSTPEQSVAAQSQHHQQYIDMSHSLPPFPTPDLGTQPLPERINMNDIKKLQTLYRDHCEATLDVVMNLQFHYIEKLWQTFWYSTPPPSDGSTTLPSRSERKRGKKASVFDARALNDPVMSWARCVDVHADTLEAFLCFQRTAFTLSLKGFLQSGDSNDNPGCSLSSGTLTQAIRNFAKSLEGWLTNAMTSFPQEIIRTKVAVVSAFAQTLRRYTSLNHLAQAARAVLQNTSQINQMLSDLNRVDFANVQEQASWVCQCDESVVQRLEQDFKVTLQQQSSLDQWATWLDNVVSQVLKPHQGSPSFPKAARQFLLKWSFYSSMVIRDLTLRSAASFGSFHLIRLLYDEYMFYLVEHRVAQATGETPIAVMGEFSDLTSMMPSLMEKDASFSDEMSDLGSDADASRGPTEPAVKRERIEMSHPLQEMPFGSPLLAPGPSILLQSVCAMYIDKSVAMSALPSLAFINTRSSRVVSFYATLQQV